MPFLEIAVLGALSGFLTAAVIKLYKTVLEWQQ